MIEKQALFTARTRSYFHYRIPGLVITPQGSVLAYVEARRGEGGDYDPIDVVFRRSTDGGLTWSEPYCVMSNERYGDGPTNNFVLFSDTVQGKVHALFCYDYARTFYMVSKDDGLTFSEPREITESLLPLRERYDWRVIAFGPGHGIQLRSGRLLCPLWMSTGEGTEMGKGKRGHRPSVASSVYSDDFGESWHFGDIVAGNLPQHPDSNETCAVECGDGSVLFNIRFYSDQYCRILSRSPDGATNWSVPHIEKRLTDPICHGSMVRLEIKGKDYVVFSNLDSTEKSFPGLWGLACDRKNLVLRLSPDDGSSWPVKHVIEVGPAGYSDLAVLPDGQLLCLYERGFLEKMGNIKEVVLARVKLS